MFDLLIRNALLYDGRGGPARRADVAVEGGRIAAIEPAIDAEARQVRDAAELWLTPGFLDIHTHYDIEVEIAPGLAESVRHGVTSVVMGHCSLSLTVGEMQTLADIFQRVENFPPQLIRKWLAGSISWHSPFEYIEHLRSLPLGPNVAPMLGHSALRAHVMGLERSLHEHAGDGELAAMRALAEEALEAGCTGISVDMVPWHMMSGRFRGRTIPSQHADLREYRMLADVCRGRDAVFQVTPNPQRPASFLEILRLASGGTKVPLRLTILSAIDSVVDRKLWRLFPATLFVMNRLLGCNIRFQTLPEPFTVYSDGPVTPLFEEFPAGVRLNDCETAGERRALWRDRGFRAEFERQWLGAHRTFHRRLELMTVVQCPDPSLIGTTPPNLETFMEWLERYDTELRWVSTGANDREPVRDRLMRHAGILPGFSDSGAHVRNLAFYDGGLSLLRQAVTRGVMPVERAIARVTGEPAHWYGLGCGVIECGARADLLLIRPEGLRSPIAPMVEISDPLLDGAVRMVKRGSDAILDTVFIGGRVVCRDGVLQPHLGRQSTGEVLSIASPARREDTAARLRIDGAPHPFTDYWDVFVLKHRHPANIALHVLGVVIFYGLLAAAIVTRNAWLLLGLPASQLVGLLGHALFERSHIDVHDAIFSTRASRCLNRMFVRVLSGRYGGDIRARLARREAMT
jgi:N-acyl-D-aspartate/D-glutamate deacylase